MKYSDGVVVTVDTFKKGREAGQGPGVIDGRPYVGFDIRIDNKSSRVIDLSQVVVTVTYGTPARVAAPVYEDPAAQDFTGTVSRNSKASAAYFFAVPLADRENVSVIVDFDGAHAAAVFSGSVA